MHSTSINFLKVQNLLLSIKKIFFHFLTSAFTTLVSVIFIYIKKYCVNFLYIDHQ